MQRSSAQHVCIGLLAAGLVATTGCEAPKSKFKTHPPGTLPVQYEFASTQTSCLVASVTMAANYLLGEHRLSEPAVRTAMKQQNLDETRVGDVRTFLVSQRLDLIVLSGRLDGKPAVGLRFWVERKGYPAICIINKQGDGPKFNHAVVVTGFSAGAETPSADIVYYLDPSTREPLQSVPQAEFEKYWVRGDRAMLLVVAPPPPESGAASVPASK